MIRNYLKAAWRNLISNRIYSFINVSGLALGLAACMLIVLYVGHEMSYDKFHSNASRIFWMQGKIKMGSDSILVSSMSFPTAPLVKQTEPSVAGFLRIKQQRENTIIQNPQSASLKFTEPKFLFADSNFFSFFSFGLTRGTAQQVLNDPFSVVISKSAAQKYFGDMDPVGKTIRYNNEYNFTVTGVAEKVPSNSSLDFDFVASLSSLYSIKEEKQLTQSQILENGFFKTFFLLKQPGDVSRLEARMHEIHIRTAGKEEGMKTSFIGIPLTSTHLGANYGDYSNLKYLELFPLVAGLILLLALINYINLSTARSTTRAKEIGVRKVMGAGRHTIALQFFIESAFYTSVAFVLGYLLCVFIQPSFFKFLQIDLDNSFLYSPYILLSFAGLFIATILLSGTYPSIILSAYKPAQVLYARMNKTGKGLNLIKFFTVFQFTISVILIIASIVINKQMIFFRNTDTGIDKENVVMVPFSPSIGKHYASFLQEIKAIQPVDKVATSQVAMYKGNDIMGVKPANSNEMIFLPILTVDENFISTLGLKWKTAPGSQEWSRQNNAVVLNETAVEKLGLDTDPVNKKIEDEYIVAGVLKDFNYYSLRDEIAALCLIINKNEDTASRWANAGGCMFARLKPHTNIPSVLNSIKTIYEKYDAEKPFEYAFMDEAFDALYKAEDKLAKILGVFTMFTILIACLGLLGLSTFTALQRTKEIGIRKVLGASTGQLTALLSANFIRLIAVSLLIASPVAWWAMNKWLQSFAYRVEISWWVFILAAVMVMFVALLTVCFQAIKTAIANPVKSLRTE